MARHWLPRLRFISSTAIVSQLLRYQRACGARPRPKAVHLCHPAVSAGQEARRRLRQVHEALEAIRKAHERAASGSKANGARGEANAKTPFSDGIVICGDFNSQGATAVRRVARAVAPCLHLEIHFVSQSHSASLSTAGIQGPRALLLELSYVARTSRLVAGAPAAQRRSGAPRIPGVGRPDRS